MDSYRIDRLPEGGFVVSATVGQVPCLFACSDIDDALGYMKDKLELKAAANFLGSADSAGLCGAVGFQRPIVATHEAESIVDQVARRQFRPFP